MGYYLYKKTKSSNVLTASSGDFCLFSPNLLRHRIKGERIGCKNRISRIYLWLISRGNAKIVYVKSADSLIMHTSCVMSKCKKFTFMRDNDFEIGPCVTKDEYRGQGIYPRVLNYITSSFGEDGAVFYMIVEENNTSSIKGIEKAGFEKCGVVQKSRFLKKYYVEEENVNE